MSGACLMGFRELSCALGASLFAGEGKQGTELRSAGFSSVSIDSRAVMPEGLFVALKGSALDGHSFVEAAFKAGAAGAMVAVSALKQHGLDACAKKWNRVLIAVEDTLKGLQEAARIYLKQFTDLVRIGITFWEPVQLSNDILEIQKRFGRQLVIGGGWEGRGRLLSPDVTDEEIRESVRTALDTYAPNGGFMFAGAFTPSSTNDERAKHLNEVLQKEVYEYGHKFYKN